MMQPPEGSNSGDDEPRRGMTDSEYRQHLVDEANTSVSFANSLATIGTVIVGYLLQQSAPERFETAIILAILMVFSSFFASIFYANVTGCVRHAGEKGALVPMCYGNALTEYFGVFLLVALFPMVVLGVTSNFELSIAAAGLTVGTLIAYHLTGFDLLSRAIASSALRAMILLFFGALTVANLVSIAHLPPVWKFGSCTALVLFLLMLTTHDVRCVSSGGQIGSSP